MVTIIIPVYNRNLTLYNAVESVLVQDLTNWQLFIVDDCSLDGSYELATSIFDSRVKVLKNEINLGAAASRNIGIKNATTDFVCFLDSDDTYEPDFLSSTLTRLQQIKPEVGLLWTGVRYFNAKNGGVETKEQIWKPKNLEDPYSLFLKDLRIGTNSGITIRKSVFDDVGYFDENLPAAEDTDLFLRIAKKYKVDYIDKVLINIHQEGNDRLSKRFDKIALAYNQIIPKHYDVIVQDKRLRMKYHYKAMWLNYHLGEKSLARQYFKKLILDKLLHIPAMLILLVFEILGKKLGSRTHIYLSGLSK